MDFFWPADDAAAVVRSRFEKTNWQARVVAYRPVEVIADGSDLMVVFRYEGVRRVVRCPVLPRPNA